jgi:hypothetical protein
MATTSQQQQLNVIALVASVCVLLAIAYNSA